MIRRRRTRRLAEYQRSQRMMEFQRRSTALAALEGRLMAALDVSLETLRAMVYGNECLPPWERETRLLKLLNALTCPYCGIRMSYDQDEASTAVQCPQCGAQEIVTRYPLVGVDEDDGG